MKLFTCNQFADCFSNPVGVADPSVISNNQIKARSESNVYSQAFYGRLNAKYGNGWCSSLPNSNNEWLQVDIGIIIQACGLATQGDKEWNLKGRWVTAFKLSYSLDGTNWETYRSETGGEMVRLKE